MDRTSASRVSSSRAERALVARCLFGAVLLGALLLPITAQATDVGAGAAGAPLVVIMSNSPEAPFVRRLAAELSLFGYRVEVATRAAGTGELTELLLRSGGAALIAVDQGRQTVDVVVAPASSGGAARHESERLDPRRPADTNAAVLAERFRARLTELGIAPGAAARSADLVVPERVDVTPPDAPPVQRRLWLAAALGGTSGGLGFVPDAALELRAFPARWLSTSAFAKISLQPARVSANGADTDVTLVSGGILIDVYPLRGELVMKAGVGAMLVNAQMSGQSSERWLGSSDSVLVPAGVLEAGAGWRLSPRFSAELSAFVGICSPRIGVRFDDEAVAHYGQPFAGAALGLAAGVF